jgi:hypothetical protein
MNALARGQRRRESSLPADNTTLEEAILEQLDNLDPDAMQAYAEYCADKIEVPVDLARALILSICAHQWEALRSKIGQTNEWLDESLNVIARSIDKLQASFIEHEAERRLKVAEEIKHEEAA